MRLFYDIRPGQELHIEEAGLRARFVSVEEDSRCPVGVNCIWAGNVRIVLSLSSGESEGKQVSLNSALDPRSIRLCRQRISIEKVMPPRINGETILPDEYIITLAVAAEECGEASDGAAPDIG